MEPIILASSMIILGPHFCLDRSIIDNSLRSEYREEPQEPVRIDDKLAIQFYRGPESWTLVFIQPDGSACIVNAGRGWELTKS
jgi:hypothetical protein